MNKKTHTVRWIFLFLLLLIICLHLYNKFFPCNWGKVSSNDIVLIATAGAILFYAFDTNRIRKQSALNQNLQFMSELIKSYDSMRQEFLDIYLGDPRLFMTRDFAKCAKMSNFVDGVGQIIFHLSETEQNIALERWAEIYIRLWIRLKDFVYGKRWLSITRDYCYFEWLACRSLEFHDERFRDMDIHFYKYKLLKEKYETTDINLIDNNRDKFRNSRKVVAELIRPKK